MDGATTSEGDSGNNFFVEPAQIGHPRAEATAFLLSELNPDRNIQAVVRDPVAWINACAGNPVGPERQCLKQAKLGTFLSGAPSKEMLIILTSTCQSVASCCRCQALRRHVSHENPLNVRSRLWPDWIPTNR